MAANKFIRHVSRASPAAVRSRMSLAIAVRFSGVRIDGGNTATAPSRRFPKRERSSGSNTPLYCSNVQGPCLSLRQGERTSARRLAAVGPKEVRPAARSDKDAMRFKVMRQGNTDTQGFGSKADGRLSSSEQSISTAVAVRCSGLRPSRIDASH